MKDNFSEQSALYAVFRPQYPTEMFDFIYDHVHSFERALDVATGNGQAAASLSNRFITVHATDISEKQLAHATQKDNIVYTREPAEHSTFPDHFFDLIIVAQAIHWFDFDQFYKEVKRTLKKDGLFVIIGYGLLRTDDQIDSLTDHFYGTVVGPYWDKERKHIDAQYKTIPFPFKEIEVPEMCMKFEWTLDHYINYLGTWSAVQHFIEVHQFNPIGCELLQSYQEHWDVTEKKKVTFPFYIKAGRL